VIKRRDDGLYEVSFRWWLRRGLWEVYCYAFEWISAVAQWLAERNHRNWLFMLATFGPPEEIAGYQQRIRQLDELFELRHWPECPTCKGRGVVPPSSAVASV
jgi:hypothetical protein